MGTRAWATGVLVIMAVSSLAMPERAQCDESNPRPSDREERGLSAQLDEVRLNVELLQLELDMEKNQLRQHLQNLKQYEFGFGGVGMMGGFGGGTPNPEEAKKAVASMRERYEELKSATLATSKKLGQERRRLAEFEGHRKVGDGGNQASEDFAETVVGPKGRNDFIRAGKFIINKNRIEYAVQAENGWVHVHFSGTDTAILSGEAAKKFLQALGAEGQ